MKGEENGKEMPKMLKKPSEIHAERFSYSH